MKKLFIISIFLCIMLFPKKTFALSYTANNNCTYVVDSVETLRDMYYFNAVYSYGYTENDSSLSIFTDNSNYCILFSDSRNNFKYKNTTGYYFANSCSSSTASPTELTCYDSNFNHLSTRPSGVTNTKIPQDFTIVYNTLGYDCGNSSNIAANYTYQFILDKYSNLSCTDNPNTPSEPSEPEETEEVNMFDVVETFLIQFINILPFIIPFILIMNLICRMLFNERS